MKKLTKIFAISLLGLVLVGCGKIPVLENGQEAVVTLKEGSISADELYQELKTAYAKNIIMDKIDKIILDAKYEETDDEKKHIQNYMEELDKAAEQYKMTAEQFVAQSYGISIDEFKEAMTLNYRRELAVKEYLKDDITDKAIEKYYEDSIYGDINVKHILISPETLDGMTSEEIAEKQEEALKEAKEVIKKLNDGEKFDELAKKYSDDNGSKSKGGDLGWFNTGEMVEEFENAAFNLKKGKYTTTPVETVHGYHIIYKVDEKEKPKLKDVKNTIIDTLIQEKLDADGTLFYKTLEKIREKSELDIIDSELKKSYNQYLDDIIAQIQAQQKQQ